MTQTQTPAARLLAQADDVMNEHQRLVTHSSNTICGGCIDASHPCDAHRQAAQMRVLVDGVDGLRDKIEQEWALRDKGDEFAQELNEWLGDIDGIFEAAAAMTGDEE